MKPHRRRVIEAHRGGPLPPGPETVHVDVTNGCNAACVTCWDHSPLLTTPRPADWRRRRLSWATFEALADDLAGMGSVRAVILSGMGEPLTHPDIYRMIARCKASGWHVTVLTNLVAADIDRFIEGGVDQVLVGVQGVTPDSHAAFHPGWTGAHFTRMCRYLRRLSRAGVATRHVQVINRDTAPEVVAMVRFGRLFRADRVNFKLASLQGGTEGCAITPDQRARLVAEGVPRARALAAELGVATNLDLFARQLAAAEDEERATVPIAEVGCFMGYVYTRVTVDGEVLYCCNTKVRVGSLREAPVSALWRGPRWAALRRALGAGRYLAGCDKCGKFEQNVKWARRLAEAPPAEASA